MGCWLTVTLPPFVRHHLLGRCNFTASVPATGTLRPPRDADAPELDKDDNGGESTLTSTDGSGRASAIQRSEPPAAIRAVRACVSQRTVCRGAWRDTF